MRNLGLTRRAAAVLCAARACGLHGVRGRVARGFVFVVVLAILGTAAAPAWASFPGRNGKIVYQWTGARQSIPTAPRATSIRAVDPRSGRVRVLRICPLRNNAWRTTFTDCTVGAPRYSPDGQRIAFPTIQTVLDLTLQPPWQSRPELGTMAADGSGFEEHATSNRYWALAWSPAGDRFLVWRELAVPYPRRFAIFLASLDGTELRQVTPESAGAVDWSPDWSSTGEIAFIRGRPDPSCFPRCENIWVTRLGGTPRRLTYRGGYSPSWSPHGTKLAFLRTQRIRGVYSRDVYIVGRDGRGLRRLTRRGGFSPCWSPDGQWIAFIRDGDIYVVRTTGRGLRRLVNAPPPEFEGPFVTSLDWQPLPRR